MKVKTVLRLFCVIGMIMCCAQGVYASTGVQSDLPTGDEQITFVELGSVKCIPCKQMQPIMNAIESEYAGRVKVVFHDVWTDEGQEYGQLYSVRLIPTQVFLDAGGNEVFRHEGFFPKEEIVKVLREAGVE